MRGRGGGTYLRGWSLFQILSSGRGSAPSSVFQNCKMVAIKNSVGKKQNLKGRTLNDIV